MDLVQLFKHMERVIYGTGFVDNEKRRRPAYAEINEKKGRGYQCPKCGIGFWGKSTGKIECPSCSHKFNGGVT